MSSPQTDTSGATVVALTKQPTNFHFAAATLSAPPPAIVVNSPGAMRIPAMALAAYRNAEQTMAVAAPGCGVSWNLLAGIGRIESVHANGGATDARGTAVTPIYGPALDGTLPGNEVIVQTVQAGRPVYARAMGPMQFLPGTWSRYASDGDGDGKADPQNVYDATLAAARYLCSGGLNLRNQSQVMTAILRYNNSMAYAQNVLGWAAAYATGVAPVDLPPIVGPVPGARRRPPGEPGGPGPRPAAQRDRPAGHRPAGPVAAVQPRQQSETAGSAARWARCRGRQAARRDSAVRGDLPRLPGTAAGRGQPTPAPAALAAAAAGSRRLGVAAASAVRPAAAGRSRPRRSRRAPPPPADPRGAAARPARPALTRPGRLDDASSPLRRLDSALMSEQYRTAVRSARRAGQGDRP